MTGGVGFGLAPGAICQGGPGPCALSCDFLGFALLPAVAAAAPLSRGAENLLCLPVGVRQPQQASAGVWAPEGAPWPSSDLTGFLEGGPGAGSRAGWRWRGWGQFCRHGEGRASSLGLLCRALNEAAAAGFLRCPKQCLKDLFLSLC